MEYTSTQRTALFVVCFSAFIMPLMLSGVNIALPEISKSFSAGAINLSWVTTAYLLTSAVFVLPIGKLADIYGRKRMYIIGLCITALASILAASAQSINGLIAYRFLQGFGAAMLFGTGIAILTSIFPPERRGSAIGLSVSCVYAGLTCGPFFGGLITEHISWRGIFIIHIPFALMIIYLTTSKLKGEWIGDAQQKFDLIGSLIYACTISGIMAGISLLPRVESYLLLFFGFISLISFVKYEQKAIDPVMDVNVFMKNRVFSFSCLASLIMYSSTFGISFLMSLYLQNIRGMSPQTAGMIVIFQPLIMTFFSPVAGKLSDKYEPRYLASFGMGLTSVGLLLLSTVTGSTPVVFIISYLLTLGFGFSFFSSPNVSAIMGSVDKSRLGVAAGSVSTMRIIGQMLSMAIVTLMLALIMGAKPLSPEYYPELLRSIKSSFLLAACISAVGVYFSFVRGNLREV